MSFRRTDRRNFSRKVKQIAFARAHGHCQGCTAPLSVGHYVYDHVIPWELSRDSSIGNCQVICNACDSIKTGTRDLPRIAKSNRQRDRHIGAASKSRTPLPCGRDTGRSKTIRGEVVVRMSGAQKHALMLEHRRIR
jgi:5-methylcytosine-specific restriction enzyme A